VQPTGLYGFGAFVFDARTRQLAYGGRDVSLTEREAALIFHLVTGAGTLLSRDALMDAIWGDVAVTDNSLEQLMSSVRRILKDAEEGVYVETVPRRGYRFVPEVRTLVRRKSHDELMAMLAPHRAWIEGRAALETLDGRQIAGARAAFESVLASAPDQAAAHLGLANACVMQFEMTRMDETPDEDALAAAARHARDACEIDPSLGESWATLGFVLARTGAKLDALAASRRAVELEPDNWRHHLRLSSIAWGEERLRSARRTQALLPGFPLAHFLAATVHVARAAYTDALREVRAGILAVDARRTGDEPRFSGVALHWLLGLLMLADGHEAEALGAFERECALEESRHLYARECAAHAWYAIGAVHLRRGEMKPAATAFQHALDRIALHPMAHLGLALADGRSLADLMLRAGPAAGRLSPTDRALGVAAYVEMQSSRGGPLPDGLTPDVAAVAVVNALASAEPGNAGWLLPVEPLIRAGLAPERWSAALARLRARAA
jgi:DNA-binding winged helix-turn-helix (wHTH) protein